MKWQPDPCLTFAVAAKAGAGAVVASFSGKHSRMYSWNLDSDTFVPGQFVKARVRVLDISPNGKFVAYYAEAFHDPAQAWIAISKPPYFTALGFFPHHHIVQMHAYFEEDGTFHYNTAGQTNATIPRELWPRIRVTPHCPFRIVHENYTETELRISAVDPARKRNLAARNLMLVAEDWKTKEEQVLRRFEREPFSEVVTPPKFRAW